MHWREPLKLGKIQYCASSVALEQGWAKSGPRTKSKSACFCRSCKLQMALQWLGKIQMRVIFCDMWKYMHFKSQRASVKFHWDTATDIRLRFAMQEWLRQRTASQQNGPQSLQYSQSQMLTFPEQFANPWSRGCGSPTPCLPPSALRKTIFQLKERGGPSRISLYMKLTGRHILANIQN